jgi:hypothetical protein
MPWTKKQKRLFFAQAERGEITHAEAERRAGEGTRPAVRKKSRGAKRKKK